MNKVEFKFVEDVGIWIDYELINDYGMIGDFYIGVFVNSYGGIDWFCVFFFDFLSVFVCIFDV